MTWLWHDDVRTPPSNRWEWAKTNKEAADIFESARDEIQVASLDHDLGFVSASALLAGQDDPDEIPGPYAGMEEGWQLCEWMVKHQMFPTLEVILHSWNPAGAERMRDILKEGGCQAVLTIMPYSKNNYRGL